MGSNELCFEGYTGTGVEVDKLIPLLVVSHFIPCPLFHLFSLNEADRASVALPCCHGDEIGHQLSQSQQISVAGSNAVPIREVLRERDRKMELETACARMIQSRR